MPRGAVSVLAGCFSTAGACSVMLLTTIILFSRFACLFVSLMCATLLHANLFLAPLLLLFGPQTSKGGGTQATSAGRRRRSWRGPRRTLDETDSAGLAAPGPASQSEILTETGTLDSEDVEQQQYEIEMERC